MPSETIAAWGELILARKRFLFPKPLFLLIMAISFCLIGCKESSAWSKGFRSPDGRMIATVQSYEGGGFGASGPSVTVVYLNWTAGSQKAMQILSLHGESDRPPKKQLGMRWVTPTQLEIAYDANAQAIDFQAVKFAGVDISLRDLPIETTGAAQ